MNSFNFKSTLIALLFLISLITVVVSAGGGHAEPAEVTEVARAAKSSRVHVSRGKDRIVYPSLVDAPPARKSLRLYPELPPIMVEESHIYPYLPPIDEVRQSDIARHLRTKAILPDSYQFQQIHRAKERRDIPSSRSRHSHGLIDGVPIHYASTMSKGIPAESTLGVHRGVRLPPIDRSRIFEGIPVSVSQGTKSSHKYYPERYDSTGVFDGIPVDDAEDVEETEDSLPGSFTYETRSGERVKVFKPKYPTVGLLKEYSVSKGPLPSYRFYDQVKQSIYSDILPDFGDTLNVKEHRIDFLMRMYILMMHNETLDAATYEKIRTSFLSCVEAWHYGTISESRLESLFCKDIERITGRKSC